MEKQREKLNINQWAVDDRPRERLMQHGAATLSNAELLAILIGSGTPQETAVDLMQRLLADCDNSLKQLGRMSLEELIGEVETTDAVTGKKVCEKRYKGLAEAKAVRIMAACELGRRRAAEEERQGDAIRSSEDIYRYFAPLMQDLSHEECYALLLNQAGKVVKKVLVSKGGLTATAVDVRIILREALLQRAPMLVLCHNHPSGNTRPSKEDDRITERLEQAARLMNIRLLDHIVWAAGGFYSYNDEGKL